MAKTSMINREAKRAKLAKQHAAKREALKKVIASHDASYEEKMAAATPGRSMTFLTVMRHWSLS